MTKVETVEALQTAMATWIKFEGIARSLYPDASEDEVYKLTKAAMNLAIENALEGRGELQ